MALHTELTRLLEVKRAFGDLSYFDLRRRSCLTIQLARLTISLPIALEQAIKQQRVEYSYNSDRNRDGVGNDPSAILNTRVYKLLHGLIKVLERMESVLK